MYLDNDRIEIHYHPGILWKDEVQFSSSVICTLLQLKKALWGQNVLLIENSTTCLTLKYPSKEYLDYVVCLTLYGHFDHMKANIICQEGDGDWPWKKQRRHYRMPEKDSSMHSTNGAYLYIVCWVKVSCCCCRFDKDFLQTRQRHSTECCAGIHRKPQWITAEFISFSWVTSDVCCIVYIHNVQQFIA